MSELLRRLIGSSGNQADVSPLNGALVAIDTVHHYIHRGRLFEGSVYAASINNAANFEILIRTGNIIPHLRHAVAAGGTCRIRLYEGVHVTANGTALGAFNRNRNSSRTAITSLFTGPTVNDYGTQVSDSAVIGSSGFAGVIGGSLSPFEEYDLAPGKDYILQLSNVSGGAVAAAVNLIFYENQ